MNYIYVENENIIGSGEVECLNNEILNIEVTEDLYNNFKNTTDKYIYRDKNIIVNPDYKTKKAQENIQNQIEEIKTELNKLDTKRIRAVCENEVKDSETGQTWLEYYNEQVLELREKLNSLDATL